MDAGRIHALFESHGLVLQEWDKVQTDLLTIRETDAVVSCRSATRRHPQLGRS